MSETVLEAAINVSPIPAAVQGREDSFNFRVSGHSWQRNREVSRTAATILRLNAILSNRLLMVLHRQFLEAPSFLTRYLPTRQSL